jgi:anaerobic ribonucleoside-triphosphate reductase activating protein
VTTTPDRLDVTITASGNVSINGWADTETLDALLAQMPTRRKHGRHRPT